MLHDRVATLAKLQHVKNCTVEDSSTVCVVIMGGGVPKDRYFFELLGRLGGEKSAEIA